MYHLIVRRKLQATFQQLNAGRADTAVRQLARDCEHVVYGTHALGGTRHSLAATRHWYGRLFRVLPGLHFDIQRILVTGWPWDTVAAVEWVDQVTPATGSAWTNQGVHIVRLRWGRVVSLRVYCDTGKLAALTRHLAGEGLAEAAAAPILD